MSADLTTTYLGLKLANPLVVGACPLTRDSVMLQRLQDAGAAAVVMPSLFEEQIEREHQDIQLGCQQEPSFQSMVSEGGAIRCVPDMASYNTGPDGCLQRIELAKQSLSIPVIGSLNAYTRGGWSRFARLMEQAGADALELNIFFIPVDPQTTTEEVENRYVDIVALVRDTIDIPLAVKIGPYFAALPHLAGRLVNAGADGLVLFNRFLEPALDVEMFQIQPHLELSRSDELRLPLRWIGILSEQIDASLAATSGIHDTSNVLRALLAGADVAMLASALLEHGPSHLAKLLGELRAWLDSHDHRSLDGIRGLLNRHHETSSQSYERANYMQALSSYSAPFS